LGRRPDPAQLILWSIAALVAVYAVGAFVVGPAMYTDCAWGFLVGDAMSAGGAFNHLVEPDPANIALDRSWFLAVWSPAQYLLPHALEALGLKLGTAIVLVVTLAAAVGLVGWYRLYRAWEFPPLSAAIALAIAACARRFALPFGIYDGGEVLLFGAAPWFLLGLWRWRDLFLAQAPLVLAAFVVVAFFKLSAVLLAYASLAALVLPDLWPPRQMRLRRPAMAALIAVLFAIGFDAAWLSRGWTAADAVGGLQWISVVPRFIEGWGATVTGMASLGDLAARLLMFPGHAIVPSLDRAYLVLGLLALTIVLWACHRVADSHPPYVRFALLVAPLYIAALTVVYVRGGSLMMEERFFRPITLILLIGVVHAVLVSGRPLRLAMAAIATLGMTYGVVSYFVRLDYNRHVPISERGFRHGTLTAAGQALLRRELPGPYGTKDTVVLVPWPEIGLDIKGARVLGINGDSAAALRTRTYKGRVKRLYVLVENRYVADGRAALILQSFLDYDRGQWTAVAASDYTLYYQ
jgi:hypothetical protein